MIIMDMANILLQVIEMKENVAANAIRPTTINGITFGEMGYHQLLGAYITVPSGMEELAKFLAVEVRTAFVKINSGNGHRKYNYFVRNGVTYISMSYAHEEIPEDAEIWSDAPYV